MEDNIIKNVRNLFRLKKVIDDKVTKDIRNLLKLKKRKGINQRQKESIRDRVIVDIRSIFDQEKEDYYKPVR